ncbi:MAG: PilW family protein [Desulfuromonas sp.]|nr:PilW family protein [Desulfuromonas sp.]
MDNKYGFTLIEVLIAMLVSLFIMGGAYTFFNSQQKQTTIQTNVSDAQQTLRAAMDFMSRDIRMAGYDPESTGKFGITDIQFRDYDGTTLDANGSSYISFAWDRDEDGTLDAGETVNYSLFDNSVVAPNSNTLMYGTPARQPLAGYITDLGLAYAYDNDDDGELDQNAGGIIWAVDDDNDGDWDSLNVTTGVTAETGTAIDTRTIRAVRIWMLARSQAPDPNYTDTKTYVVGPHISSPATRADNRFRHRLLERTVLCRNMGL